VNRAAWSAHYREICAGTSPQSMTREEILALTAETTRRDAARETGYFRLSDKQRQRVARAKEEAAEVAAERWRLTYSFATAATSASLA
jgi:hypothetical protein